MRRTRGTGLILPVRHGGKRKYVFPLSSEKYWKMRSGKLFIEFTGVGGKLELAETRQQAVLREAREELGCEVKLRHAKETIIFDARTGKTKRVQLRYKPAPIVKYREIVVTPDGETLLDNAVWVGVPIGRPKPSAEVPALLLLTERMFRETLKREVSLSELLKRGAKIIEARTIPREAIIAPFGSPKVVGHLFKGSLRKAVNRTTKG